MIVMPLRRLRSLRQFLLFRLCTGYTPKSEAPLHRLRQSRALESRRQCTLTIDQVLDDMRLVITIPMCNESVQICNVLGFAPGESFSKTLLVRAKPVFSQGSVVVIVPTIHPAFFGEQG